MSPALLLLIFTVELSIYLFNTIGAATINALLWRLLNLFPLETSRLAVVQRKQQQEFLKVRRNLNATSSQDEFAKWAKLRRQHDKLLEQLEQTKQSTEQARAQFDAYVTGARWLLTRVPQWLLPFWYGKEPMFWLPHGRLPYYAEWLLAFPRAPMGSVSIVSWQAACAIVIGLVGELVGWLARTLTSARTPAAAKEKVKVPAKAGEETKKEKTPAGGKTATGKKDL